MRSVFCDTIVKETMNTKSVGYGEAAYQITITRKEEQKPKRIRSAFTTDQIKFLEETFKKHPYIDNLNRKEVARVLNITERSVKIWFQNRRMREKHDNKEFDVNKRNSPNSQLTNSSSSTNRAPLPIIMTSNVDSNAKNTDNNINTESLKMKKERSKLVNERTGKEKLRNIVKSEDPNQKAKTAFKHQIYCKSGSINTPASLSSTQVHTKSQNVGFKQVNYCGIPKTVNSSRYYPPGYVGSTAIWRPVEMVPVVSKKAVPVLNTVKRSRPVSSACCKCNCHNTRNASMMKMVQQKPIYPYPYQPLMFTAVPYQNHM